MVRLLLSRGANINAFDKRDRRAIHWAAYMGKISHRDFPNILLLFCVTLGVPLVLWSMTVSRR